MLYCEGGLPLGIDAKAQRHRQRVRVPPGAVLVLTTDGLLETDGDDVDYNVRCMLGALEHGTKDRSGNACGRSAQQPAQAARHGSDVALLTDPTEHVPPVWSRRRRALHGVDQAAHPRLALIQGEKGRPRQSAWSAKDAGSGSVG